MGVDTGLLAIKQTAAEVLDGRSPRPAERSGRTTERDMLAAFADHVVSFIDPSQLRPMRVVADTANGMGGLVVPAVFERLPRLELEVMYAELDGTFPNHPADPLQSANQRDLQARVTAGGFDIGLAFDGDQGNGNGLMAPGRQSPRRDRGFLRRLRDQNPHGRFLAFIRERL